MNKDKLRKMIGDNIRNERIKRNLSIDELAELLGLTSGFVGLIERGKRGATAHTLYRLSSVLDLPLDRFFEETGSSLSLREKEKIDKKEEPIISKRSKLNSLIYDLNEIELEFLISVVKSYKTTQNLLFDEKDDDDED